MKMRVSNLKFISVLLVALLFGLAFTMPTSADEPVTESWVVIEDFWGRAEAVAVDSNDNIIVTGSHFDTFKYDKHGNELWNTTFPSFWSMDVAVDSEDNIVVIGYGASSIQIIKYDSDGSQLWNVSDPHSYVAKGVAIDSNDNIVVIGYNHPPLSSNGTYNITVHKFDPDGSELWNLTYDSGYYDYGMDIALDSSDNIIITGYVWHRIWHSVSPPSYTDVHYYLTKKYNPSGTELWTATYDAGDDLQEYAYGIAVDSDDNIIVTGWAPLSGTTDFYTIKYAPDGTEIWNATYNSGSSDEALGVAVDSNDNIIIVGYFFNFHHIYDYYDSLIVKYDTDGNELWNYTINVGGEDRLEGVAIDSNNNIIAVGWTENWTLYNPSFVIIKLIDDDSLLNELEDMVMDLDGYIHSLPADAFRNNPTNRKNAFSNKLDEVWDMIEAGEFEDAIDKLEHDIRAKADGSLGGNPSNDWVTDPAAQEDICELVDELISYLETLI